MVRHLCNLVISIFVKQVKYTSIKPLNPVYPIFAVFLSLDCIFDVFFYICQLFMGPYNFYDPFPAIKIGFLGEASCNGGSLCDSWDLDDQFLDGDFCFFCRWR